MSQRPRSNSSAYAARLVQRHLLVGWAALLVFLALGIVLETLHGLKAGYYLDPRHTTRRLVWTLAHTHGTLFALLNVAWAVSLNHIKPLPDNTLRPVSLCLTAALLTLPLGFFLGGLWTYGGDPGLGILLVPVGAFLLLVGIGVFVRGLWKNRHSAGS